MIFSVLAIVLDFDEEGALLAPHVIEYLGHEIAGNGHQRQTMTFAGWLTGFDVLVHGLILGYPQTEVKGDVDGGIAGIR